MSSNKEIGDIFGIIGTVLVIILWLGPMKMIIVLCKEKKPERVSEFIFLLTTINCTFWTALFIKELLIIPLIPNIVGITNPLHNKHYSIRHYI
jgi:hypothetical protein